MRRIIIVLFIFTLHACCNRNSKPTTPAQDSTATPIDTTLEVRYYEGILPAADCEGIRYDLTLTNQKFNGDGTYHLTMTYLKANRGKDHAFTSTGDFGTLRGSADDINATVYQLRVCLKILFITISASGK